MVPIMGTMQPTTNLGAALFTRTQRRVIGLLFGQPERSFYTKEVVRLAEVGIGTVQRELAKLASVGLITTKRVGNQTHYQANRGSPIFEELRGIVLKTFGLADVIRSALEPLAEHIETAFIYGSVAKESDTASSDIDVMIVGHDLTYGQVVQALAASESQLGRSANPSIYDPGELRNKLADGNAFLTRILAQPKILLIGSQHDLPEPRPSGSNR